MTTMQQQTLPMAAEPLADEREMLFVDRRAPSDAKAWSANHLRLLYLLSKFAMYPTLSDDEESWLRNLPLLVLVYEAIVCGILDYDYSPVCTNIVKNGQSRRIWMNISQDAKAAIDDLREHSLVKALKTCSEDFQPSTAFQVTPLAMSVLKALSTDEKRRIDVFLTHSADPPTLRTANSGMILFGSNLVVITFDVNDGKFRLERNDGSVFVSRITDVEEVSYVSSPYLPSCLMRNEATFSSNAHKASLCRQGANGIQDSLSFAIVLSHVRVMVGEWIPFGPNQIVMLNDRLGSLERCQGGLFTSELDLAPTSTTLHLDPGLTKIAIVDFEFESFTNFEADIHAPNDAGIVQIESFGMHLNGDGTIVYGMYIDAIMDQPGESICVDHLARLLVDVDLDSSKIIDDLLSPHQRGLMDMLFMKDATSRSKFNLITAREILPRLPVRAYLDRGEMENELKQVLGEIHAVYDLSDDDKILVGRDGMLLVGPNANQHEPLIVAFLALLSRELFIRFFFKRTFILDDMLNRARTYMKSFEMNPEALGGMRAKVDQCSHDLVILEEILGLLRESMRAMTLPKCPADASGKLLYEQLQLRKTHTDLEIRSKDLAKLLRGFRAKLKQVQSQNGNMAKTQLETIVHSVERNLGVLADGTRATERSMASSFDFVLVIFTGLLAFEIIDRITDGHLLGIDGKTIKSLQWANDLLVAHIVDVPGLWFVVDVTWMLLIASTLRFSITFIINRLTKVHTATFALCARVNVAALECFIETHKVVESRSANFKADTKIVKVVWREQHSRWRDRLPTWHAGRGIQWNAFGAPLQTQVTFDLINSLLLEITFHGDIHSTSSVLYDTLVTDMRAHGCFDASYVAPCTTKRKAMRPKIRKDAIRRMLKRGNAPVHPTHEA